MLGNEWRQGPWALASCFELDPWERALANQAGRMPEPDWHDNQEQAGGEDSYNQGIFS